MAASPLTFRPSRWLFVRAWARAAWQVMRDAGWRAAHPKILAIVVRGLFVALRAPRPLVTIEMGRRGT